MKEWMAIILLGWLALFCTTAVTGAGLALGAGLVLLAMGVI